MLFEFGAFRLDAARRELRHAGSEVPMEPQVFDLLVHLLRHRDQVVSKDDLIRHVWGGRIVSDATIDSRIKAVRQAIGDSGATQALLRTFPRKGVRFIAPVAEPAPDPPVTEPASTPPVGLRAQQGRPSIAVLAFDNISGDPGDAAFADGVAEDIILALGREPSLVVIARASSFMFKDRRTDIREIARVLAVRYVLTGSVRRGGDRVRVGAQLIDTETTAQIWAERYDRPMLDTFAVQDEIAGAVASVMLPALALAERRRALLRPPTNLDAWETYQRALGHWAELSSEAARGAVERTIALDDRFAPAHAMLADILTSAADRGASPFAETVARAEAAAQAAVTLDPDLPDGHAMLSRVMSMYGRHADALAHANRAVTVGPNHAGGHMALGQMLVFSGDHDAARQVLRTAMRLNPVHPTIRLADMLIGASLYLNQEYRAAADHLRDVVLRFPRYSAANRWLLAALGLCGETEEAHRVLAWITENAPDALSQVLETRTRAYRPQDRAHILLGLRAGGWTG